MHLNENEEGIQMMAHSVGTTPFKLYFHQQLIVFISYIFQPICLQSLWAAAIRHLTYGSTVCAAALCLLAV